MVLVRCPSRAVVSNSTFRKTTYPNEGGFSRAWGNGARSLKQCSQASWTARAAALSEGHAGFIATDSSARLRMQRAPAPDTARKTLPRLIWLGLGLGLGLICDAWARTPQAVARGMAGSHPGLARTAGVLQGYCRGTAGLLLQVPLA